MVDKMVEEITETAIEMIVMTKAGTGLEKSHFPETIATMLEIEVQVQIGIEFDVISVEM